MSRRLVDSRPRHALPKASPEPLPPATPQQFAFRLVIELYRATSGRAMTHIDIDLITRTAGIPADQRDQAVAFAVEFGLVEVVSKDCICLTDQGRRLLR